MNRVRPSISLTTLVLSAAAAALMSILVAAHVHAQDAGPAAGQPDGSLPVQAAANQSSIALPIVSAQPRNVGGAPPPLCRFGINSTHLADATSIDLLNLAPLRASWYIDYTAPRTPTRPNGIEHAKLVTLLQTAGDGYLYYPNGPTLLSTIRANPGNIWLIGNEPDRRYYQNDVEPHVYAAAYHELYELIKSEDPTAKVFAGSIVQATEVRLKYLDMILASYQASFQRSMPVDGWSIHGFVLNEVSCEIYDHFPDDPDIRNLDCFGADIPPGIDDLTGMVLDSKEIPGADWPERNDDFTIFRDNILRFRQWMADRGYRNVPLYLTEYGVLMPSHLYPQFTPERVNAFMNKTFDFLLSASDPNIGFPADDNRLVQRLSWYSTTDRTYNGHLFDLPAGNLSAMGVNYATYTANIAETQDLFPVQITTDPAVALAANGNATITIRATIANSGNRSAKSGARVRFYLGDPRAGGTPIGPDKVISVPGCGATATAETVWSNVAPDTYEVFVQVYPDDWLAESNQDNDLAQHTVFFAADFQNLPLVDR